MSFKKNIFAGYISQIYVAIIGIVILPLYIKYLGPEAYGLIGFFTLLQAWFSLLDIGLTPTISRETARYRGGSSTPLAYRQVYRALSLIFVIISIFGAVTLSAFADTIASMWLNTQTLASSEVIFALHIIAVSVALRWLCGLPRGIITGSECLVWLSYFNVIIATLRFVAVFFSMTIFGFTPTIFFIHQLVVALIEFLGLWLMGRRLLPSKGSLGGNIGWSLKPIRPVIKFSLGIAFTSSIWILITQTDKLVLSGILPLAEYGNFTLAVLAASSIMLVNGPISNAIMPRMAKLHAEKDLDGLIKLYKKSTQLVSVIAGSAAITICFCAKPLLFAWTGDLVLSAQAAPILQLYVIGNGFLVLSAFPYYFQYAVGNLRYHLIGNAVMGLLLIPSIIMAATYYGGAGAGYIWLSLNALYLIFWTKYVHDKLAPNLHLGWIIKDILCISLPTVIMVAIITQLDFDLTSRIWSLIYVMMIGSVAIICSSLSSTSLRDYVLKKIRVR